MAHNQFMDLQLVDDDLLFVDGDFVIDYSDEQHISDIIRSFQGEWKQTPQIGVGILGYLNSSGQEQVLSRSIRVNLESDGYTVRDPKVTIDKDSKMLVLPNAYRE